MGFTIVTIKKSICRFYEMIFKKDITIMEVVLHTKYINTELVYLTTCEKLRRI